MTTSGMTTTVFVVPEISCATCQSAIETAVRPTTGVRAVAVDVAAKTVTVQHEDTTSTASLAAVIENQGYDVRATHTGTPPHGGDPQ